MSSTVSSFAPSTATPAGTSNPDGTTFGSKTPDAAPATFETPGPGSWEYDRSHCPPAPTLLFRRTASDSMETAYRTVFEQYGAPLKSFGVTFVHGKMYRRLIPLIGGDKSGPPPPKPVLWLATRLHPAFRRREKQAIKATTERPYLDVVDHWKREREEWIAKNRALQGVDFSGLDDAGLADHVVATDRHLLAGWVRHHLLHGSDVGPIGDLLVHTTEWGIDPRRVMQLLEGASPATTEGADCGRRIAAALRAAGVDPLSIRSLAQVREVPAASAALDDYLDRFGWRVVSSYDVEGLTTGELPAAICTLIRSAGTTTDAWENLELPDPTPIRDQIATEHRPMFDELLDGARRAYGLRDDNGPLTAEWPMGLVRRAYLEAGRRLAAGARLQQAAHVFELDAPELAAVLRGAPEPTAAVCEARAAHRAWEAQQDAPALLGPAMAPPDLSAFPPGLRRVMNIVVSAVAMLEVDPAVPRESLAGLGIGDRVHRGIARVATDPDRVLQEMEPGDVLVAAWTAPSYNAVFSIAGAVVVQEGGLLCHAAVMARELSIPSVIGCREAMTAIADGDLVEVDPIAGRVRVLERASERPLAGATV
jgi:pyruvate,water dikinase